MWWLVNAHSHAHNNAPSQHTTLSLQSRTPAARLARPGRYHIQVREEWSAPAPGRTCTVACPAGESCGVPPRRFRRAARPHPRRPEYRVHHAWTAPPGGRPAERGVCPSYGPVPRPAGPSWAGLGLTRWEGWGAGATINRRHLYAL